MIEENKIKEMDEEELIFLLGELKKINDQIKNFQYSSSVMESQTKLWEIRGKIKVEIDEIVKKMTRKPGSVRIA